MQITGGLLFRTVNRACRLFSTVEAVSTECKNLHAMVLKLRFTGAIDDFTIREFSQEERIRQPTSQVPTVYLKLPVKD